VSSRETILAAITALVSTATGFTSFRSRQAAVGRVEGTVAIVEPAEEETQPFGAAASWRKLTVSILFVGRDPTPDQALDAPIAAMHAKLMADLTLGGVCARIVEEGTRWNIEVADITAAAVDVRYVVHYLTPANSLASTL
jgi:hypothetical protein